MFKCANTTQRPDVMDLNDYSRRFNVNTFCLLSLLIYELDTIKRQAHVKCVQPTGKAKIPTNKPLMWTNSLGI